MKTTIFTTCAALILAVMIGRSTVASTPMVASATIDTPSQWRVVADISTTPIVASAVSGGFGYGPVRTTDW